jgi:hypothetical protein
MRRNPYPNELQSLKIRVKSLEKILKKDNNFATRQKLESLYKKIQSYQKKQAPSRRNPAQGATKIYDACLAVIGLKGAKSNFPRTKFIHKFKDRPSIYGLGDGSILIKGKKPLWKVFRYQK